MLSRAFLAASMTVLGGCALQTEAIRTDMLDYSNVLEEAADKSLVVNILEARDGAPMHFVAFPRITGSLKAAASLQSALPFVGDRRGNPSNLVTGTVTPNISVESTPSFEVTSLDTKDFAIGMSSQIEQKYIKYWLDRGLDKRLLLLLFFSSVQIGDTTGANKPITIWNNPRWTADAIENCSVDERHDDLCHARTGFELYLKLVNVIAQNFKVNLYSERTKVGNNLKGSLKDIGSIDPAKYQVELKEDGHSYNLYTVPGAPKVAICITNQPVVTTERNGAESQTSVKACTQSLVTSDPTEHEPKDSPIGTPSPEDVIAETPLRFPCATATAKRRDTSERCKTFEAFMAHPKRFKLQLSLRTVGEAVRFVGDVVHLQDVLRDAQEERADTHHNLTITLDYDLNCHDPMKPTTDCVLLDGGYLFRLNPDEGFVRFSVAYRGNSYAVAQGSPKDHTLEVLSVLNLLVNINKSATDLRTTPLVQVLPQ